MYNDVFMRVEKKYLIDGKKYNELMKRIQDNIVMDSYGPSTICNIYYDTGDYELIRNSIEKPVYKEKIRVRSYGIPDKDSYVFLEIKKKCDDVVNKRRVRVKLGDVYKYLEFGEIPNCNTQIMNEIDYCFKYYDLKSAVFLSYDRCAYYGKDDSEFRITFDNNIVSRNYDLKLEDGVYGDVVIDNSKYIMEVKTLVSLPVWFSRVLSELQIYPTSFSKYGVVYKNMINDSNKLLSYQ